MHLQFVISSKICLRKEREMIKGLYFLSLVAFLLNISACETTENTPSNDSSVFIKLYGGSGNHVGVDMIKVSDGYFLLGNYLNLSNRSKLFLVRTDDRGNELWAKTYGGNFGAEAKSMAIDLNENLIISSTVSAASGDKSAMLLRVDQQGNKIDSAVYGSPIYDEEAGQVIVGSDGSYLMIGTTWELDSEDEPGRVNKIQVLRTVPGGLDTLSKQVWKKFFGQGTQDYGIGIVERNNIFYCYGYTNSDNVTGASNLGGFNLLLFQINQVGSEELIRVYGTSENQIAKKILAIDQGFVLLGETALAQTNSIFITRVSDQLAIQNSISVSSSLNIAPNTIFDIGLSYLVLGSNIISNTDSNISLTNIDKSGNIIWQSFFGAEQTLDIAGFGIQQTEDRGISFIGTLDLENQVKMCLIKVNSSGELTP